MTLTVIYQMRGSDKRLRSPLKPSFPRCSTLLYLLWFPFTCSSWYSPTQSDEVEISMPYIIRFPKRTATHFALINFPFMKGNSKYNHSVCAPVLKPLVPAASWCQSPYIQVSTHSPFAPILGSGVSAILVHDHALWGDEALHSCLANSLLLLPQPGAVIGLLRRKWSLPRARHRHLMYCSCLVASSVSTYTCPFPNWHRWGLHGRQFDVFANPSRFIVSDPLIASCRTDPWWVSMVFYISTVS